MKYSEKDYEVCRRLHDEHLKASQRRFRGGLRVYAAGARPRSEDDEMVQLFQQALHEEKLKRDDL
jgi:hypothetical protein